MTGDSKHPPSYDWDISRLFFFVSIVIPVTLILALILFSEPFHFLQNAFSELGETVTSSGHANVLSRWVFSMGWIACGLAMAKIGRLYSRRSRLRNAQFKQWLAWAGSFGFFLALAPNDISHLLHSIGTGLVVAATFFFGILFLLELRTSMRALVFYSYMLFLLSSVLTYAITFFTNSAGKQAAQKLCVFGLVLVVEKASSMAPNGFEWKHVLQAIRK